VDAILTTLGGSLPQLGVGGVLAFVVGLLVKWLADERTRHTADLDAQARRLADENAREAAQHTANMTDLRGELRDARTRIDELEITVDLERAARRDAEDTAARALRGTGEART
jgi:hypothetical protein